MRRCVGAILATAVSGFLGCQTTGFAEPYTVPALRHVNYLVLQPTAGATLSFTVNGAQHGYQSYQDALQCRLVRPDGFVVVEARAQAGQAAALTTPVNWAGNGVLEVRSRLNLARVQGLDSVPHGYRSMADCPLRTVGAWGPLHLYVPAGVKAFDVWVQADVTGEGVHVIIRDPAGQTAREEDGDFDARTKLHVNVGAGQDGTAWSVEVTKPQGQGLNLDDVNVELGDMLPPFLAPKPEWAPALAVGWAPPAPSGKPSTRFPPMPPALPAFSGVTGPDIDRVYSRDTSGGWRTSLPFTYVLDYGAKHVTNPEYVPAVATAPPVLLHLGKDVPFNHGWGPVKGFGGENQAYGFGEHIERLTPDQVRERLDVLKQMVAALHTSGVRWVTPYICAMTLNGNPEKRTGFWEFYDHWDEYCALGLAPKPAADPAEWLQRKPDGTPLIYYAYTGDFYPPYKALNHRYAACWRAAGWRTWLCEVVRFVAKTGGDGVFVDNGTSLRCQCDRCLAAFREHLTQAYTLEQVQRLFGKPVDGIGWPGKNEVLLGAEMQRLWCEALRSEMAGLKAAGTQELGREFIVFPNGGRPAAIQGGLRDADFVMFEKSEGDYGTNSGVVLSPVMPGMVLRSCNDSIFEYKFVQCLRQRVRPIILSRGGYPRELPWQVLNPNTARLGMAECGAFSGGGGFLLRPEFGVFHDALNEYRRFFETHPDLYAGLDSYARVGVLAFAEQDWLGNPSHMSNVSSLTDLLATAHVLFDYVPESVSQPATLARYATLLALNLKVLCEAQLRDLEAYVKAGGHLLVTGEFGVKTDVLETRNLAGSAWARVADLAPGQSFECERGRVSRAAELDAIPAMLGADAGVLRCPDPMLAPYVRANAFATATNDGARLVLHVVNYNTQLGMVAQEPVPMDGIQVDLPLPAGMRAATARCFAPDEAEPSVLNVESANGRARFALPPLRIYRVVELQLARE